nr:response regulator [Burkholderia sp. WP9]
MDADSSLYGQLSQIVAIVDDDESTGRAIKCLLRVIGMEPETFSSGEEFLGRLASTASYRPACVVLDFLMPGINGLELMGRLTPSRVPQIFITAQVNPAVREKALASGAVAYLRKPFSGANLVEAVAMALAAKPIPVERATP